jgi:hypothetical protein
VVLEELLLDEPAALTGSLELELPHAASMPNNAHNAPPRITVLIIASPSKNNLLCLQFLHDVYRRQSVSASRRVANP